MALPEDLRFLALPEDLRFLALGEDLRFLALGEDLRLRFAPPPVGRAAMFISAHMAAKLSRTFWLQLRLSTEYHLEDVLLLRSRPPCLPTLYV